MTQTPISGANDRARQPHKRALVVYVIVVDLLALLALFTLSAADVVEHRGVVVSLVVLAAIAGSRPIRIPMLRTEITASDPFVITALGAAGGVPAVLVCLAGLVGAALGRGRRSAPIRLLFNLGAVTLPTVLAYHGMAAVLDLIGSGAASLIPALFVATTVFFVANSMLVTAAISLERGLDFMQTWIRSALWTAVSAYAGLTLAVCLLVILSFVGPWGLALGIPPSWLLIHFYRTHKERLEEQQKRIDQVVVHNEELERRVRERTRELEAALDRNEEANLQLRVTNEKLAEASRAKSVFLANVSHELRTPLNGIIGFSELLADISFGPLNQDQREFTKDIHDSGLHLLNLINDILDLSKIEAGRMELHRERCSVREIQQEAIAMLSPQAGKKAISLVVSCADDIGEGEVDPGMFRQSLVNLLSNAVKFTPESGRVELRARREESDLVIEVSDTGIGISREDRARIFDEFYQVDNSYSRTYEGTGLGLALVRRLVGLHGGSIAVDSTLGEGTTFTLRFPGCLDVGPTALAASPTQSEVAEAAGTGQTVLVVEDHAINRKLARNVLCSRGFTVLEATTGEEALELVSRSRPDLILMDIQLPGLDGLEVTRRLGADAATADIPVVALTAHAQQADERRALEAGCVGYIAKPIRLNRFPTEVASFLTIREGVA
jgi:signal transduction histidine kinase/CheY-like chemotaxis protein